MKARSETCQGQGGIPQWEIRRTLSLQEDFQAPGAGAEPAPSRWNGGVGTKWPSVAILFPWLRVLPTWLRWRNKKPNRPKKTPVKIKPKISQKEAWKVFNDSPALWGPAVPIGAADLRGNEEPAPRKSRKQTKNPSWTHPVPRESNKKCHLPN